MTLASSQGVVSVLWLSLGVVLDLGRGVSFGDPSLGTPLVFMGLFSTNKRIYCLSGL